MMGSPSIRFYFIVYCLSLLSVFYISFSSSLVKPLCQTEDLSALLQFRESFNFSCDDPVSTSKLNSWNLGEIANDCCSWDGVECDGNSGYVTGLDLSNSCLHGTLNSSNGLFNLLHLEKLNLAFNDFKRSPVPSSFVNLSLLTSLNLSSASFSGQAPSEISLLSRLVSLDLSSNFDVSGGNLLQLSSSNFVRLIQNLTRLEFLDLSHVNLSSNLPKMLANSSSLTSLHLSDCDLLDDFPIDIFQLPNLQVLDLSQNPRLTGHIPEVHGGNKLTSLLLRKTSFSGPLPASIGNMNSLKVLDISFCNFSGLIPYSLGNLSNLVVLDLGVNSFNGLIPFSLGNLTKLNYLSLYSNNFTSDNLSWIQPLNKLSVLYLRKINLLGEIPSFGSLNILTDLDLGDNQLIGEIPNWLTNLTQLKYLDLGLNKFHGSIPGLVSELKNLNYLNLGQNNLSGSVEFDMFLNLKNLKSLNLALNRLSVITTKVTNSTSLPSFVALGLCTCNLVEFPEFLRYQHELEYLDLSINSIPGKVPRWIWNMSTETLEFFDLSYNLLTDFIETPAFLPWSSLSILNLSSNFLQGSVPIPKFSIVFHSVSNNSLTGSIPLQICELSSLKVLDLSDNNLSGTIPECLSNFSNSLSILNLQLNNFTGSIPSRWTQGNSLRMIDLGSNNIQGPLPKTLANCERLEILDLGKNSLNDTFPFWLGTISELKILNLQSNQFHGEVGNCTSNFTFQKLRIIDLSSNRFIGKLPADCLGRWTAMKVVDLKKMGYMQADTSILMGGSLRPDQYYYSMTMKNKGINMNYSKVMEVFTAIDLSCNRFQGEIPKLIGSLIGLQLLNLSNNIISGPIPSTISKLTLLESLDLSQNQLSGQIPRELKQLTFLGTLSLANNNLTGPIPQGNQFDTFTNSSFDGNTGLCGKPLSVKCIDPESNNQAPKKGSEDDEEGSRLQVEFEWKAVVIGYGSGIAVGLVMGHFVITRNHNWFSKTFERTQSILQDYIRSS